MHQFAPACSKVCVTYLKPRIASKRLGNFLPFRLPQTQPASALFFLKNHSFIAKTSSLPKLGPMALKPHTQITEPIN